MTFLSLCDIIPVTILEGSERHLGIIKQFDKRSGITYVYENKAYWDKEKKQSRAKRTLIGRLDPETGEVIPTDGRMKKAKETQPDYESMYKELLEEYQKQKVLIESLKKQLEGS